ncbi:uncharacterized mitochondrial protein AtMg00810-like [Dioscorea cayenensis subsp. rotundata]|uniref:Uncharacterized mitochondrial protein AtMg00810-like n=1 Tax=Dioscorea cayennensis subsp. rotundata TaxID=55577 RepID=A0AB40AJU5_DIOCR|nr:uncharacterized mitochondrial protein AtMg00810-like [Dioscorea cayenensis subsp. rotundata]
MTDLGLMSYFLGLEVKQNSEGVFISQQKYIDDLLVHMNMKLCKPVSTPLSVNEKLEKFITTKRVVRYFAGTKELGLWYSLGDDGELEAFSDSDWGGSKAYRKSTTGIFLKLGSSPISWGSRKQDVVALSITEA